MSNPFCSLDSINCIHYNPDCEDCDFYILPEDDTDGKFEGEL